MPYTTTSPNLPANVKKLGSNQKKRWVSTFNSAYAQCRRDGGKDCDAKAFKIANGNLKKKSAETDMKPTNTNLVTIRESEIREEEQVDILEATEEKDGDGNARILKVNFMKEGPGNKLYNNYYKKSAVESVQHFLDMSRKKMYLNHSSMFSSGRDIRDWASSVLETWVETKNDRNYLNGKVSVYDEWLWDRAQKAPKELALSIEGRGKSEVGKVDGKEYNIVSEISDLNSVCWVDYPGNAKMGVKVGENKNGERIEKEEKKEETQMLDFAEVTEKEVQRLKEERPELFEGDSREKEAVNSDIKKLQESMKELKKTFENDKKSLSDKVDALEAEKAKLSNLVEAHEIKAKEQEKRAMIEKLLSESKLPESAKTDTFKATLMSLKEKKVGDKSLSVEEQAKELISDREKVCVADKADATIEGDKTATKLSEQEQTEKFASNMFDFTPEKKSDK